MANIQTTARPFNDDIEEFEVRIRIEPERNPSLDDKGQPKTPRALAERFQVEMRGTIEHSDAPDERKKKKVGWMPLDDAQFTTPQWTPGDAAQLQALVEKFHEFWTSKVV